MEPRAIKSRYALAQGWDYTCASCALLSFGANGDSLKPNVSLLLVRSFVEKELTVCVVFA